MTCDISDYDDALNRLIRVDTPNGTISYVYNGDNQRVMKTTATSTTHYVFDGLSVVAELDATGTVTKAYNPGISYTDDQGSTFYYMYDGLGSVVNLVDEDQNIVQAYSYDAWGKAEGVEKDFNSYHFVGVSDVNEDQDTELLYMWNRWYDKSEGRFISRDPIGFLGGINHYRYVRNNPLNAIDFMGLDIIYLYDEEEFSHAALLIGDDTHGWTYYSFAPGNMTTRSDNLDYRGYTTFNKSKENLQRYEKYARFKTNPQQDKAAKIKASKLGHNFYFPLGPGTNCVDVSNSAINTSGIKTDKAELPLNEYNSLTNNSDPEPTEYGDWGKKP